MALLRREMYTKWFGAILVPTKAWLSIELIKAPAEKIREILKKIAMF